jgi:agmatinase
MNGPANFLALPPELSDASSARYLVLPVPYEATVSYKSGTAAGPMAIIDASAQVERFDEELLADCAAAGVATLPVLMPAGAPDQQVHRVRAAAQEVMAPGRFLMTLGGEHSITTGLVQAARGVHGELSVLQIDAHADLRDTYNGERFSHACVMRRVMEVAPRMAQVGIRNFSREEYDCCRAAGREFITPAIIASDPRWIDRVLDWLGPRVYITIDIDGFDPAMAPGTGTPEPGGLWWNQTIALLRKVCTQRQVVSADIVEVRPIPPNHITEFLAARLACKLIAYTQR